MNSNPLVITKTNPYNGSFLYQFPQTTLIELIKMIQKLNKSFLEWKKTTLEERRTILERIIQNYLLLKKELIYSEALDQGLNLFFTEKANYQIGFDLLKQFETELNNQIENAEPQSQFSPNGVVAVILSWNLSNRLFIQKVISALMAGNTVLIKCSAQALSTAENWKKILNQSGVNEDLVQFVYSDQNDLKKMLSSHPGIKAITVTGRLETCSQIFKDVAQQSLQQFKKLQMHSGSKNSCLFLEEPDQEKASQVLDLFITGQGQLSWNSSRLFILEKYFSSWFELIKNELNRIVPSQSPEDLSTWGPLIKAGSSKNYELFEKMARDDQAKLISADQKTRSPFFRNPQFTYDMSNCSELQQDQIHTPLFILSQVKYGFDIPKYSNVSYYGQTAEIFGSAQQDKITQQLDVGEISFNRWSIYKANDLTRKSVKQSIFGDSSSKIFGAFNSNVKVLT